MSKIKILHLLKSNSFSGAESVVCNIIDMFKDDEQIEMLYCSVEGPIEKVLQDKNINYYLISKFSYFQIQKVIESFNPDIIHTHDFSASTMAAFFSKKNISHLHSNPPWLQSINIKSFIFNLALNNIRHVIGVSESIYNEFYFKKNISSKFITLNNVVNQTNIIRLSNLKKTPKFDLIFLGRLEEVKNPILFIDLVKKITENNSAIKAIMIGDGSLKKQCIDRINTLNLQNNIEVKGFLSNPYPYLRSSKMIIIPSLYEGFGLVAVEAMMLKTLVLCSGKGGLQDIISSCGGFICSSLDDYYKKIIYYHNCDEEYLRLVSYSEEKIVEFNSIDKFYFKLKNIYFDIGGKNEIKDL